MKKLPWKGYAKLMRLNKPVGIFLLMWPMLWALWISAQGFPHWRIILIFLAGTVLMRSAGCIINDIADRHIDGKIARTQNRPLVTGEVTLWEAWLLFSLLCLGALGLVLLLNAFARQLAVVALALAIIYPFTKRVTFYPQLFLGLAFAWAVPMAFAATQNYLPPITWLLFAIAALWPIIYDTFYAMADRKEDIKAQVKSIAIVMGHYDKLMTACLQISWMGLLILLGILIDGHLPYYTSLVLAACLMFYQQWLIRHRTPKACFHAFLNNQWVGLIIFLGVIWGTF